MHSPDPAREGLDTTSPSSPRHVPLGAVRLAFVGIALAMSVLLAIALRDSLVNEETGRLARFNDRSEQSAPTVAAFVRYLQEEEMLLAERLLTNPNRFSQQFSALMTGLQFDSGLLVDASGVVEAVYPRSRDLVGEQISGRWVYLDAALQGQSTVSDVVIPSARSGPAVAFPVDVELAGSRYVVSGSFSLESNPLEPFLTAGTPVTPCWRYLIDSHQRVIATNQSTVLPGEDLARSQPEVAAGLQYSPRGRVTQFGESVVYSASPVPGTPWSTVCAYPTSEVITPPWAISPTWRWVLWGVAAAGLVGLSLLVAQVLAQSRRVRAANELLTHAAITDPLTGLPNRAFLNAHLLSAASYAHDQQCSIAVVLADIDHFKAVNDTHGHLLGDEVLKAVATRLRASMRDTDVVGRWGGEEFVVVANGATADDGARIAERIRLAVKADPIMLASAKTTHHTIVTISAGVASLVPNADPDGSIRRLMAAADDALYEAKHSGRNCVRTASAAREDPSVTEDC